jgi:hypothetical protein
LLRIVTGFRRTLPCECGRLSYASCDSRRAESSGFLKGVVAVNPNLKIFITIFCYITGVMGLVSTVIALSHKPAESSSALVTGVVGVGFLLAGLALTRKPRY